MLAEARFNEVTNGHGNGSEPPLSDRMPRRIAFILHGAQDDTVLNIPGGWLTQVVEEETPSARPLEIHFPLRCARTKRAAVR